MKISELAPYVGTGQGWDTQYESILVGLLWLHGGFGTCCSLCNRRPEADPDRPSVRAEKRLNRKWEDDPVAKFQGVADVRGERERVSHDDDIATAVLVDELMHEQRDAQACCDSYDSDYPVMTAYKELVKDLEQTVMHIAEQGPQKWRDNGHPLPADMEDRFPVSQAVP